MEESAWTYLVILPAVGASIVSACEFVKWGIWGGTKSDIHPLSPYGLFCGVCLLPIVVPCMIGGMIVSYVSPYTSFRIGTEREE